MNRRTILSISAVAAIAAAVPAGAATNTAPHESVSPLARFEQALAPNGPSVFGASGLHAAGINPGTTAVRAFDCNTGGGSFVVPGGVGSVGILSSGGDGGSGSGAVALAMHDGGRASLVFGAKVTVPGETLNVIPGCAGGSAPSGTAVGGLGGTGWRAGGHGGNAGSNTNGGGGGGGASAVVRGSTPLLVAAGGGGAGSGGLVSAEGAGGNGGRNGGDSTVAPIISGGAAPVGTANGLGGAPGGFNGSGGQGGRGGSVAGANGAIGGGGGGGGLLGGGGGGSGELSVAYSGGGAGGRSRRPAAGLAVNPAGTGSGYGQGGEVLAVWLKPATGGPSWPGQDIARGVVTATAGGGYVVDLFGGIHPFRQNGVAAPPAAIGGPYWSGADVARGIAIMPNESGGFVLDRSGALHGFKIGSGGSVPTANHVAYWAGLDIARGVVIVSANTGIVADLYGGLHLFGINGSVPTPLPPNFPIPYTPGIDRVRGLTISALNGGLEVDAYGNFTPWGLNPLGAKAPGAAFANPFGGQARVRGVATYAGGFPGGYVLAGDGTLVRFSPVPFGT